MLIKAMAIAAKYSGHISISNTLGLSPVFCFCSVFVSVFQFTFHARVKPCIHTGSARCDVQQAIRSMLASHPCRG